MVCLFSDDVGAGEGGDWNRGGFVPRRILGKYSIDLQLIYLLLKSILCYVSLINCVYRQIVPFKYLINKAQYLPVYHEKSKLYIMPL